MRMSFWVVVVAVLFIVAGIVSAIWGLIEATTGGLGWLTGLITFTESVRLWGGSTLWSGLVSLVVGTVQVVVGFGLFARQYWAWLIALILSVLWVIDALVGVFGGNPWAIFAAIIPGSCVVVLLASSTRRLFQQAATR